MVVSRKLVTAIVTYLLVNAVALVVNKFSLHLSAAEAAEVAGYVGIAAAAIAGFIVREVPNL